MTPSTLWRQRAVIFLTPGRDRTMQSHSSRLYPFFWAVFKMLSKNGCSRRRRLTGGRA